MLIAILEPAKCSLLELPVQLNGAASLALIDSSKTHCFMQQTEILNSCAMLKGCESKVQLATGHEFRTIFKCLMPITFDTGL